MKTLLLNLILFCSVISFGQDRVNKELPKISKNTIGKLTKATGWHLDEKGQWTSRPNRVTDVLDALDNEKLAYGTNLGIDNFISYHIRTVKMNGKNYFIFIKKYKDGTETKTSRYTFFKSVEFVVFDSIKFSKTIDAGDTVSFIHVNTLHSGGINWPTQDTTLISDIESELATRKPNDGFHGWDILFRCRLYKSKNIVQFMQYKFPYREPDFKSCYYETDIANFKNLFGPDLHLNFDDLYAFTGGNTITDNEISMSEPQEEIFTVVEEMPDYPGGIVERTKFIQANIKYPESASKNGISGKCFLKFIIKADGSIGDVTVLKGVSGCPECDNEAIRVIKLMPKWKPGKQNGRPVAVFYNLPINFIK